jgi:hypothetical protein
VLVRAASRDDLEAVERLTVQACADAYADMVPPEVVAAEARTRYPGGRLREKLLAGELYVGEDASGDLVMVALVSRLDDHVALTTVLVARDLFLDLSAEPLVRVLRERGWLQPIVSDVVLGNAAHERFHENAGFAPGDVAADEVQGHPIFRRAWWLPAASTSRDDG